MSDLISGNFSPLMTCDFEINGNAHCALYCKRPEARRRPSLVQRHSRGWNNYAMTANKCTLYCISSRLNQYFYCQTWLNRLTRVFYQQWRGRSSGSVGGKKRRTYGDLWGFSHCYLCLLCFLVVLLILLHIISFSFKN